VNLPNARRGRGHSPAGGRRDEVKFGSVDPLQFSPTTGSNLSWNGGPGVFTTMLPVQSSFRVYAPGEVSLEMLPFILLVVLMVSPPAPSILISDIDANGSRGVGGGPAATKPWPTEPKVPCKVAREQPTG
jgi:hypothetical protein